MVKLGIYNIYGGLKYVTLREIYEERWIKYSDIISLCNYASITKVKD